MEIRQLMTFISLVNTGNFSQSASILGYTQSTVSMQMKSLETELGGKLYTYTRHQFKLTDMGKRLVPIAERLLDNYSQINELNDKSAIPSVIKIAAPESISCVYLPDIIRQFREVVPNVRVEVVNATCLYNEERLLRGEVDVAFMLWPMKVNNVLVDHDIGKQAMSLITDGKYKSQEEILSDPDVVFLTNEAQCSYRNQFETATWLQHQHKFTTQELASLDTIVKMVSCGVGFSYVPEFVAKDAIKKGTVKTIENDVTNHIHMHLLTRSDSNNSPIIKQFVDATDNVLNKKD
ncbi:LysR family transcriptional regulator [Lentilactobacillus sp. SPB1-3]|uniref:LysR family transcriptional regulator n=1 Tax=Lentilactobacillus terminaliae TaxID=3003483 RepID=A0ACD5DDK9_9LACO|nr:LysR family transcriptional regulator [Lentilactobacillus sp. SPB1-3]MCZ0977713.1 LysR family transcriptional regulator [Lentilactobacillus sp. SPB1-3]